jgi:hypothetical protein
VLCSKIPENTGFQIIAFRLEDKKNPHF